MNLEEPLQSHSLNEILEMYIEATDILYDSQMNEESKKVIKNNQKLVDDIERAIFVKRVELPPLK